MFKGKQTIDPSTTDTLIGEGSIFDGELYSAAGIRIEGKVNGDVKCDGDVTIGKKGLVRSNISARNLVIAGEVTGDVSVREKLVITPTGKLQGNIAAASLIIEEGAVFHGSSKMETPKSESSSGKNAKPGTRGESEQDKAQSA